MSVGNSRLVCSRSFSPASMRCAVHPRPWPESHERHWDVASDGQPFNGGINPAIQRNVGAGESAGNGSRRLFGDDGQVIIDSRIVARFVDLTAHLIPIKPPTNTSDRKCWPASTRARLTAVARPYAPAGHTSSDTLSPRPRRKPIPPPSDSTERNCRRQKNRSGNSTGRDEAAR